MNKQKFRMMPGWNKQPVHERLDLCVTFLVIHSIVTDAEKEKMLNRIQKRFNKGEYFMVTK